MTTRTIAAAFDGYKDCICEQGLPEEDEFELRSAFYAGALTMFVSLLAGGSKGVGDTADEALIEGLDFELREFRELCQARARGLS